MDIEQFFNERRYSEICDEFPCKIKYPKFYEARKRVFTIHPGDKLYIPFGWFHLVYSEGDGLNFAINFFLNNSTAKEGVTNGEIPHVAKSELETTLKPEDILPVDKEFRIFNAKLRAFPSDIVASRHKGEVDIIFKTLRQFMQDRDPHDYLLQGTSNNKILKGDDVNVWINWGNVRTYLHYDTNDNWLHQISGSKRVILFPPGDRDLMYVWNKYPLQFIFKICEDENVILKRGFIGQNQISDFLSKLGAKTSINLDGKFILRTMEGIDIQNQYVNLCFLSDTILKIKHARYMISPGDAVSFPNHFTYNYEFQKSCIFILEP
jgi:hypothetical protein